MDNVHYISSDIFSIEEINTLLIEDKKLALSEEATAKIEKCRNYLDEKMKEHKDPIYGINTGFGSLYNVKISDENLSKLQENLMKSHACGTGPEIPQEIVKIMLLLKIQSLSYGNSGVQLKTVERLIDFYNNDILPIVYEQGSLGLQEIWLLWLICLYFNRRRRSILSGISPACRKSFGSKWLETN
ncbi:aromatic amino acid lyase [Paenimyroides ceti]|uniref:aromatic amino acid lyase n=1 Tax=Paenimyroides ceti TaxID=395087 RepID=UPI0037C54E3D